MADKAINAVLSYTVTGTQDVVASTVQVTGSIDDFTAAVERAVAAGMSLDEALAAVGQNSAVGIQGVTADLDAQVAAVNSATQSYDELANARFAAANQDATLQFSADAELARANEIAKAWEDAAASRLAYGDTPIDGGGGGDTGGDTGGGGSVPFRALSSLARVVPGGAGAGRLFRGAGALQTLGVDLGALGGAALIASPAIVLAAVAVKGFADEMTAINTALEAAIKQEHDYYNEIAAGTTTLQATNALQQAYKDQEAAQQNLAHDTQALADAQKQAQQQTSSLSDDLIKSGGILRSVGLVIQGFGTAGTDLSGPMNQLKKAVTDDQAALTDVNGVITTNTNLLKNNALVGNDLTNFLDLMGKRLPELKKGVIDFIVGTTDAVVKEYTDAATAKAEAARAHVQQQFDLSGESTGQLDGLLRSTQEDIIGIQAAQRGLNALGVGGGDAYKELNKELTADQLLVKDLKEQYIPLAEARDHEIQQMDILTRSSQAYTEFFTKNIADQKKANDDIAKLDLDHADKVTQIKQDAADKETQIALDYADKVASIVADEADKEAAALSDRNGKLADAQTKASDALVKLSQDSADKRARIERDFASSADTAIANRDAAAFGAAEKKRDDDLKDLNDANARQKATIKKALADQQVTIEKAYQKQLATAKAAEQKQLDNAYAAEQKSLNAAAAAANAALNIENNKYTKEIQLRQRALDIMVAQYNAAIAKLSGAGNAGANGAPANVLTGVNYTNDPTGLTPEQYRLWAHFNHIPGYALGGIAQGASWVNERGMESGRDLQTGRMMYFANPTQIYTAQQTAAMGGGNRGHFIINVNGVGRTKGQLMQEIERKVDRFVESF